MINMMNKHDDGKMMMMMLVRIGLMVMVMLMLIVGTKQPSNRDDEPVKFKHWFLWWDWCNVWWEPQHWGRLKQPASTLPDLL